MSNTDFLGRAIDVVKKAIENDTAGEYEKAYQLYYQAREALNLLTFLYSFQPVDDYTNCNFI